MRTRKSLNLLGGLTLSLTLAAGQVQAQVTSVGLGVPASSLFGVTGSPVTSTGTLGLTTTGTSGGMPYFSSTSQMSSSGLLTANAFLTGGGAGAAPNAVAITGLVKGNGASAPVAYGGASCTNQFVRSLDLNGAATCATVGTADLASSLTLTTPNIGDATAKSITQSTSTSGLIDTFLTSASNGFIQVGGASGKLILGAVGSQTLVQANNATPIQFQTAGGGLTGIAAGSVSIGAGPWQLGNQAVVTSPPSARMAWIDNQLSIVPDYNVSSYLGSIYTTKTYAFAYWGREFTSSDTWSQNLGTSFTGVFQSFNHSFDTLSQSTTVALGAISTAFASGQRIEAFNAVCLTGGGSLTGVDINCLEVDYEPASGDHTSGGGAISASVFTAQYAVPGFYTSSQDGLGQFLYDFLGQTASGSNYYIQGTGSVYGFDATGGTFSGAGFALGADSGSNHQRLRVGVGGSHIADIYGDGTNLIINSQGPIAFNNASPISNFDFKQATDQHVVLRGKQNLSDGVAISSLNDANSAFKGLELQGSTVMISEGSLQFLSNSVFTATSNCGSLSGSTKCIGIIDPSGNTMYVPAYGTF
jgi:hypothetical protein